MSTERFVSSGDVRLSLTEAGDRARPTVVLVHGYPDSKEVWGEVFRRLAARFHVVAYDVRGAGGSTAPRDPGGYDLAELAADLRTVLADVAPGKRAHLVGHDWGSIGSWELVTQPDGAERLASFTSISGPSLDHIGHWLKRRLGRPTPARLAAVAGQGARAWYVGALATPAAWLAWRRLPAAWPGLLERLEGVPRSEEYPAPTLARDGRNGVYLYRHNIPRRLQDPRPDPYARVPVQLIVPSRERFVSPRLFDDLHHWVPSLRRHDVEGGHWLPRSNPDEVARLIAAFVDDVEKGQTMSRGGRFADKLVLVTGAGSGIGRATAVAFAGEGARVVAADIDRPSAERTVLLAGLIGPAARAVTLDVADGAAFEALARELGPVDVLVNNAGIGIAGPFLDTSVEDWRRILDVNLWGVIHGSRVFGRAMAERGRGAIVNVASAAGFTPTRALPAYATTKAAVLMLSQCLRAELHDRGVGVTAICPGLVETNITRASRYVGLGAGEARAREAIERLYHRRAFPPEGVATAILDAVAANEAVVPVTLEAKVLHALSRLAPSALRRMARLDALRGRP